MKTPAPMRWKKWTQVLTMTLFLIAPLSSFGFLCPAVNGKLSGGKKSNGCKLRLQFDNINTDQKFSGTSGETGALSSSSHTKLSVAVSWVRAKSAWYLKYLSSNIQFSPLATGETISPSNSISGSDIEIGWRKGDQTRFTYGLSVGSKSQTYVSALNTTSITLNESTTPYVQLSAGIGLFSIYRLNFVSNLKGYYLLGEPSGLGYAFDIGMNVPLWSSQLSLLYGVGQRNNTDSFKNNTEDQWIGIQIGF